MQDPELKEVIDDTENNTGNLMKLSDYDLFSVSAGPGEQDGESCNLQWCSTCHGMTKGYLLDGELICSGCDEPYNKNCF